MSSENILDVTETDFEFEVVAFSRDIPVVVDFWAEWSRPCMELSPLMEQLAVEARGGFRLAKVNSDRNPNLILQFSIRTLPTVISFSEGRVAGQLVGLQPFNRLRDFIEKLTPPSKFNLELEKASSLLAVGKWPLAEQLFRAILSEEDLNPDAQLGLAKSLLPQSKAKEAMELIRSFPASPQHQAAERLLPLTTEILACQLNKLENENDLDAAYLTAIRLCSRGNLPSALDGLLDILRQDRNHLHGKTRQVVLGVLDLMSNSDPVTRQYRSELATILFK